MQTADNDALMRRVADGDTQAFAQIVAAYQGLLVRFATRCLGDADAAQDAAQEAFLRLWRQRQRYEPRGCLQAYLLRTVRTVCIDCTRASHPWDSWDADSKDATPGPETLAQLSGLAEAVACAVQSLPEGQRAVFILSQYEGLSYAEIAAILACPVGTVASRKHQATETLRRKLSSWRDDHDL
jgi:RNA polymerase sigma-70 factor (ECF subfamily)